MKHNWSNETINLYNKYIAPDMVYKHFVDINFLKNFVNILNIEIEYYIDNSVKKDYLKAVCEINKWIDELILLENK